MRRAAFRSGTQAEDRAEVIDGRAPEPKKRASRRAKLRQLAMESLEGRALPSTLPTPSSITQTDLNSVITALSTTGNSSTPTIVIDPQNPQNLAAFWIQTGGNNFPTNQLQTVLEGAYSINGGSSWAAINYSLAEFVQIDISRNQQGGPFFFTQVTDPTLAFDGAHQLYLSFSIHNADYSGGAIELQKFDFSGGAPVKAFNQPQRLYQWSGSDAAFTPTIAVDDSITPSGASFLQGPVGVNVGPAGNIYVSTPAGNEVMQFDKNSGALLNVYATTGQSSPQYQAFNNAGTALYVPNQGNDSVTAYSNNPTTPPTSAPLAGFTLQGDRLDSPRGAVYGPDLSGNLNNPYLYVVSQLGNRVLVFDGASGAFVKDFVAAGVGGLSAPDGIAFDSSYNLYVSSTTTNTVLEFAGPTAPAALQGTLLKTINGAPFSTPGALAFNTVVGSPGATNLFVANTGNDSVQLYDGVNTSTLIKGQRLSTPQGALATTLNGVPVLLVANKTSNSILEYDGISGAFIKPLVLNGGPLNQLNQPDSLAVDAAGNIYVTSSANNLVLRYDANGNPSPSGVNPGAIFANAGMSAPAGLAFDPLTKDLFVVSSGTRSVERFDKTTGALVNNSQYVSNSGALNNPDGITFGSDNNLYISSSGNNTVVRYQGTGGATPGALIGNFVAPGAAGMSNPKGLTFDPISGDLFVAANSSIYRFFGLGAGGLAGQPVGNVTLGNGIYANGLTGAYGVTFGGSGSGSPFLFATSSGANQALQYAGTQAGGPAAPGTLIGNFAALLDPTALAFDGTGNLFVAIGNNGNGGAQKGMVVEYTLSLQGVNVVATYAGTVVDPETAAFTRDAAANNPTGLAFDSGGRLYVANNGDRDVLRFALPTPAAFPWNPAPSTGNNAAVYANTGMQSPFDLAFSPGASPSLYVTDAGFNPGRVVLFAGPTAGNAGTLLSPAGTGWAAVFNPESVAFDAAGNLYVANQSGNMIEEFNAATGAYIKTLVAPNYLGFNGGLVTPTDMVFHGGRLYVSSTGSQNVLEYDGTTGAFVSNFTNQQPIADPEGVAFDSLGRLYVADGINNDVLRFASSGAPGVVFVAAPASSGQGSLRRPRGIAFDAAGNLYVASNNNNEVERYFPNGANNPAPGGPGAFFAGGVVQFTDPLTGAGQGDAHYGDVFVGWVTNDALQPNTTERNPNNIRVVGSDDGGVNFSAPVFMNTDGNYFAQARNYAPSMAVGGLSSVKAGPGGVLTTVWDNNPGPGLGDHDNIMVNQIADGVSVFVGGRPNNGGAVADAGLGANPPNSPSTTPFGITVGASDFGPRFDFLSNLTVTVNLSDNNGLQELALVLIPPSSTGVGPITLLANGVDARGNPITGPNQTQGTTGNTMGQTPSGNQIGVTFDVTAARPVTLNASPLGRFRPEDSTTVSVIGTTNLLSSLFSGRTLLPKDLAGTWTLDVIDFRNNGTNPTLANLSNWSINFTSGMHTGGAIAVGTTSLRGNLYQPGTGGSTQTGLSTGASVVGVGAQPVIAADKTLGAFSPTQGNLYIAYTDRATFTGNPGDNSDITIVTSTNGGTTWGGAGRVNDDIAQVDGFSEGDRPQFQPQLAVDQATGTVALTYLDTRYDAARVRTATMLQTSIDGGSSFSASSFLNPPELVRDETTNSLVNLGPIPDNQSSGNPVREGMFGFGNRFGVAVWGGHVYSAWSSNQNGGLNDLNGNNDIRRLDIEVANAVIGAGPRIVSGTSGPVGPGTSNDITNPINGGPGANAFVVTFDRPILISSFTANDVVIRARDVNGNLLPVQPTVTAIFPLGGNATTATSFGVNFTADYTPGTVSYAVGPNTAGGTNITDSVRWQVNGVTSVGNPMDQKQRSYAFGTFTIDETDSRFAQPMPSNGVPLSGSYDRNSLPIIIPGPHVLDTNMGNQPGDQNTVDNEILNAAPTFMNVVFNQDMLNSSFTPAQILQIVGPSGPIGVPVTYASGPINQKIPDNTGQPLNSQILIPPDSGSFPISHLAVTVSITHPQDSDLTGYLIAPNGTQITLFQNVGGTGANFVNTVFDDAAATSIVGGTAPFTGSYRPQQALSVLNGMDLASDALHGVWTLRVVDGAGNNVGTLVSWSLTATPSLTVTPRNDGIEAGTSRTFRVGFPQQQLSGTYTISLAPTIASAPNAGQGIPSYQLDQNLNAGVYNLMGFNLDGSTASVVYNNGNQLTVMPQTTLTSTISIGDLYNIAGETLQLNILDSNDPDLTVSLLPPAGLGLPPIVLFSNIGSGGTKTNFQNTIFDDFASTLIDNGGPPFLGRFRPENPLSVLNGLSVAGDWQLQITNNAPQSSGRNAVLTSWSLTFSRLNLTTGLGETVADQASESFRIFTMDPTNPLSSSTWTAVGPASVSGVNSGRIGGIAVDPSDPSGNTVYVGGASGGVWKSTNFLTTSGGPTYIPLTNFGETFAMNIGGIAVFPRNNDTRQSIVFAATGEGDTGSRGVGVLRSFDGGQTWQLLDSTVNVDASGNYLPINSASRDHAFVGSTAFKIMVDPKPTPAGNVIVYMALSGNNGGVWVSYDSGNTWGVFNPGTGKRQAQLAGQATDVAFGNDSGTVDKISNPTGNLQVVYAGIRGQGVYLSSNEGASWNLMLGGVGDPLIQDSDTTKPVPVGTGATPNGGFGRIVLASAAALPVTAPNAGRQNFLYAGWLYAVVVTPDDALQGVYLTKDFGLNWTKLQINTLPPSGSPPRERAVPTNAGSTPYDPLSAPPFSGQGNYDVSVGINPLNPNIIYIGGTTDGPPSGLIRVDATAVSDPYSFYMGNNRDDGGNILTSTSDPITLKANKDPAGPFDPRTNPYINLLRNPNSIFGNSTYYVDNVARVANSGANVKWIPFDIAFTDQHRMVVTVDPLTGLPRLIIGDDQGVFTAVDNNGTFQSGIGTAQSPGVSRNGNLQITQFYYGAAQPSNIAASIAGALFYGSAQDDGTPTSSSNVLNSGNIQWFGPTGDATGVATDQTGSGTYYQYDWPCCGGNITDFFQRNGTGATNGLLQASGTGNVPDPQWPFVAGFNFAVNPINGNPNTGGAVVMSSAVGRFFRTQDGGRHWFVIANPGDLDGSVVNAPAFGAPDPVLNNNGSLDDFIYAGTAAGHIYVTTSGGGVNGSSSPWVDITNGDLAGNGASVQAIVTDPTRGSHRAYAVTTNGVYFIQNSVASYSATGQLIAPATTWVRITGNLFGINTNAFGDGTQNQQHLAYLTSIAADWRYVIPNANFSGPITTDPRLTHPMLYVAGEGGVYRSTDNGKTWALFPSADSSSLNATTLPPGDGGGLPNAHISDLDLALGNVDPTTGHPVQRPNDPNILAATTFGRGVYAIRLAPSVFAASIGLDPTSPPPNGSDNGRFNTDRVTNIKNAVFDGYSEATNFGGHVRITLYDYTNPAAPVYIGGFDGTLGDATDVVANYTDSAGHFSVQITNIAQMTDGVKTIGVQATDDSGTRGNIALFTYSLITTPPDAPSGITLNGSQPPPSGSDSGVVGDNITNVTAPYFDVAGIDNANTPGFVPTAAPFEVFLYRSTSPGGPFTLVNQIIDPTVNPTGLHDTVTIQDPGPLPGSTIGTVYYYYATQQDVAGNTSNPSSPVFSITVKTSAQTPGNLKLDPNKPAPGGSDTGLSGTDSITDNNKPFLNVLNIEPTAQQVLLLRATSAAGPYTIVNTQSTPLAFNADGSVTIQDPGPPPPDGTYFYAVEQVDVAGNLSAKSAALQVLIVTSRPTTPSIALDPNSDSGVAGDKITSVTNPTFDVSGVTITPPFPADGPYQVLLLRATSAAGPFTVVATGPGGTTGSATIQDPGPLSGNPPVGGVSYWYEIEQEDVAGNISNPSTPLKITIKTTAQTPSGVKLDPNNPAGGSDTGTSTTDSITNNTHPWVNVANIEPTAQQVVLLRSTSPVGGFVAVSTQSPVVFNADGSVSIQDPGPVQPDAYYYYEVEQVDVAGNTSSPSAPLQVLVVAAKPSTPSFVLDTASDSGVKGDNITNSTAPTFDVSGVTITPPFPADGPYQVLLLRSTSPNGTYSVVKTVSGGTTGAVTIQDDSGALSGNPPVSGVTYYYKIEQEDVAGNISTPSAALPITIKTMAQTPGMPTLDPNNPAGGSDTGPSAADNVTNDAQPWVIVSGIEPTAQQITLLRATSAAGPFTPVHTLSSFTFNADGSVSIQDPGPVPADGTYYYEVQQLDVAGNTSVASSPLQVLIVTSKPSTPSVTLDPTTDTGPSSSDNITKATSPQFIVTGLSTTPPFPADGPYTVMLLRSTSASGPFVSVPFTTVSGSGTGTLVVRDNGPVTPDGDYYYEVQQEDVAGNLSPATTPVHVLIVTSRPSTPAVALDAASDSGVPGDNITNSTSPTFDATAITITPPFPADGPYLVHLLRSDSASGPFVVVNTVSGGTAGSTTIQDNSGTLSGNPPIAGRAYYYELTQEDVAGNVSNPTAALKITIKTAAQTPDKPTLDPATDSNPKGDNTTAVTNPSFDVTGIEQNATKVILLRAPHGTATFTQVGSMSPVVFNGGVVTITDTTGVTTDGQYDYEVEQVDVANNTSAPSAAQTITINTQPPATPPAGPVLTAPSDSGVSSTDRITNHDGTSGANKSLIFTVNVSPATDTWVRLFDVTGGGRVLVAGPVQAVAGVATLTIAGGSPLADGAHQFAATEAANGNANATQGPISASTPVTIITSTAFTGYSTTSNFYNNSDHPLPGSFVATFSHALGGIVPDRADGTGFNNSNAYAYMLVPSGPDDATAAGLPKNPAWSGPSGIDMGDLPLHSTLVYHVNGTGPLAGSQITLTPTVPMGTNLYLLSVGGLFDVAGNPVTVSGSTGPFFSSFDYRPTPVNLTPPTITSVTANHGASAIFPFSSPGGQALIQQPDTIAIHFSKPMDFYQVAGAITLNYLPTPGQGSVPVAHVVTYSPSTQTAYVTPTEKLFPGRQYVLAVNGNLTDDQGFPNPGVPLGATSTFAFQVSTNAAGPGVAPLKVTATSPANGTLVQQQFGYVSVTFTQPISMQSLQRYSAMLVPSPAGPNNFTPMNAKLAFNPNTNQLIIVPTDVLGNALDVLALANIHAALTNGQPNPTNPLLNNAGKPAAINGNAPYYATWQLQLGGPAAPHAVTRQSASAMITVSPPADPTQTAGAVVTASAATTTSAPTTPVAAPTDHVSGNRVAQEVTIPKRGHARLTMRNSARDRGDVLGTALIALERDRVRPGRWI